MILSVVFFCVTFLIYFIFFLQIPNTTKTHTSHSHLFLFLLCYLVSSFFCFLYLLKVKSNQHTRFFSHNGRKTLIVIFVINKQARAQARAKPNSAELNTPTRTHARTNSADTRAECAQTRSASSARTRFVNFPLFYYKQTRQLKLNLLAGTQ